jgi:GNAT superfamily N-acetyltransferase
VEDHRDIGIEDADPGDAVRILEIQREAFAPAAERYHIPDLPPLVETIAQVETAIREHVVLKAVDATGTVLGAVRGEAREGCVHVGRLVVDPAHQRRGVATRLMVAIERRFPDAGCFELFTGNLNEPGMGLYAKLGYVESRRERVRGVLEVVYLRKDGPAAKSEDTP